MTQTPSFPLLEHPAFRGLSEDSASKLESNCNVLRFELGGQLCDSKDITARILVILQGQARLVGRHNGRLTTVGKFGPGSVIGAASLLCGAPCENVIAAEEVIACSISDELWRELYSSEVSFRHWCDQQLWPQELLKLLEALEQNTPEADSSALEKLEDAIQADIERLSSSGGVAPDKLSWPVKTGYVSSGYKWRRLGGTTSFHGAIDIAASRGTPIYAAGGGVVILARYYGNAGRTVFIDHGGGMTTLYFHMDKILVSVGQTVITGDQIGTIGTTGRTTGPHLHFETRLRNPSSANCSLSYLDPTSRGRVNPYCFLD